MSDEKKYIEVVSIETGEVVNRVDVTGKTERYIDKCLCGMLINLDRENYCLREPKP
jgi:hypothetical protein